MYTKLLNKNYLTSRRDLIPEVDKISDDKKKLWISDQRKL